MDYAFMGIDPGETGCVTTISQDKKIIACEPTPLLEDGNYNISEMLRIVQRNTTRYKVYAVIEDPYIAGIQAGMKNYLVGYGIWLGFLKISLIVSITVTSSTWTKVICEDNYAKLSYSERKKQNGRLAQKLFPEWKPNSVAEIKQKADSFLIATYCRYLKAEELKGGTRFGKKLVPSKMKIQQDEPLLIKPKREKNSSNFFLEGIEGIKEE